MTARQTEAAKDALSFLKFGCSYAQYRALVTNGAVARCHSQKVHARLRGIDFELSLWQWWTIWQESGHWEQRGRGNKYMMCRKGDAGPYAVGNVFIARGIENSSRPERKSSGLPMGVSGARGRYIASRLINGKQTYLGIHPTPELAHAAYLAADPFLTQQVVG